MKWEGGFTPANDLAVWQALWDHPQGEAVKEATWPALLPADPCDTPVAAFRVVGTHAGFAALSTMGTLGCDVTALPGGRDAWPAFTYDRLWPPPFYPSPTSRPPEIPAADDDAYYGESLNPTTLDLGEHLQKVQGKHRLGRKILLRLEGHGVARTSPILLKNVNLTVYFEPQPSDKDPLVLEPEAKNVAESRALIQMEGGSLEIIGGTIRFPNNRNIPVPTCMLKVQSGNLRLSGCRLEGPLGQTFPSYQNLIQFHGSALPAPARL